ncbi:MAG: TRAP transporter substrate-binding protein [Desulfohalobiaceae bacterium]
MRKWMPIFLVTCIAPFFVSEAVQAGSQNLTYSSFFPSSHVQSDLAQEWAKTVEEETQDQVQISFYPGQSLSKADQTYDAVLSGRVDIGMSCLLYTRGRFPLMDFINLPFGNPSGEFATAVLNEVYDKFQPQELEDVQVMYLHAHGPGLIHTKKNQVSSMEDLKNLKLRCPGSVAQSIELLGATPVTMPMPEVYQALQKNVVQGAVYPLETNQGWKMGEVVDFATAEYSTAYSVGFFVVMNKDTWQSLPDDVQESFSRINQKWAIKHGQAWDQSDYNGLQSLLRQGKQIKGVSQEESRRWEKAVEPVFDKYVEKNEEKGLPGKEVLDFLDKRLNEYQEGEFQSKYVQ